MPNVLIYVACLESPCNYGASLVSSPPFLIYSVWCFAFLNTVVVAWFLSFVSFALSFDCFRPTCLFLLSVPGVAHLIKTDWIANYTWWYRTNERTNERRRVLISNIALIIRWWRRRYRSRHISLLLAFIFSIVVINFIRKMLIAGYCSLRLTWLPDRMITKEPKTVKLNARLLGWEFLALKVGNAEAKH